MDSQLLAGKAPPSRKLEFIFFSQILACLLVVYGHSFPLTTSLPFPAGMATIQRFIYSFHMPLFVFISGYLLIYSNGIHKRGFKSFIKEKGLRLLTPYLVLSLIGFIPKIVIANLGLTRDSVDFSLSYFLRTLFVPRENVWGHFWFLPMLLLAYLLSPLLLRALKDIKIVLIMSLAMLSLYLFPVNTPWFALHDLSLNIIFFWSGMLIASYLPNNRYTINQLLAAIIIAGFVSLTLFFLPVTGMWSRSFSLLIALFMICCVLAIGKCYESKGSNWLRFFNGKYFTIFLFSWPSQAIIDVVFNGLLKVNWYTGHILMFAGGVIAPLLLFSFIKRFNFLSRNKFVQYTTGI